MRTTVLTVILLALWIGAIFLQVFLSKKKSKWFGLILPTITFLYSLLMVLNIAVFETMSGAEVFMLFVGTLLLNNIPTIVLLGIYFGCRERRKTRAQIDKMNIQDLG